MALLNQMTSRPTPTPQRRTPKVGLSNLFFVLFFHPLIAADQPHPKQQYPSNSPIARFHIL